VAEDLCYACRQQQLGRSPIEQHHLGGEAPRPQGGGKRHPPQRSQEDASGPGGI
jgi:hypothetical protein